MLDQTVGERWKALGNELGELQHSIEPEIKAIRAKIEPRATEIAAEVDTIEGVYGELRECEACSKVDTLDAGYHGEDGWFCSACIAAWQAAYDACEHNFVDGACTKCTGLDPDADA